MYRIFSLDTETVKGRPYTIQLCNGEVCNLYFVNQNNILDHLKKWLLPKIWKHKVNCIYVHYLAYDLTVLLSKYYRKFTEDTFAVSYKGMRFKVRIRKGRFFCDLYMEGTKITFVDTFHFFPYSLEYIADKLNLKYKKLPKPKGLGLKALASKCFVDYAKQDALITFEVGKYIQGLHKKYNIPFSISIAQLGQYIFQTNFLKEPIYLPSKRAMQYSLLAYHGGKNAYYFGEPKLWKNVYEVDIVSAYPYAMSKLPNFYGGYYCFVDRYVPGYTGVYYIEATVRDTKYKVIPTQDFKYVAGKIKTFITGFELQKAIRDKLLVIHKINGWIFDQDYKKKALPSPLFAFVDHFFKLKQNISKDKPEYIFYKLILNSLYGKFIQRNELERESLNYIDEETYKITPIPSAGGMFNPFIAAQITGFVRAMLYDLEKKFSSIHTSTDSIKTQKKPTGCSDRLGGYKVECFGNCLIFRPKLYLHFDKKGKITKSALHGFQGTPEDLFKIWKTKKLLYIKKRIIPVRESLIRKLDRPLQEEKRIYQLKVNLKP